MSNDPVVLCFSTELWRHQAGQSAWFFVTVPVAQSNEIRAETEGLRAGFGSVRVSATIGTSTWHTSVFPESKSGQFMLPVKKAVRRAEDLEDGDVIDVTLELVFTT